MGAGALIHAIQLNGHTMIRPFKDDEEGYLGWVHSNPEGFVVNVDAGAPRPQYPMVHQAEHRLMRTLTNYTRKKYIKFCSNDLDELKQMALADYKRPLNWCKVCAKKRRALSLSI